MLTLKENKIAEPLSVKQRPYLPLKCVNLTLPKFEPSEDFNKVNVLKRRNYQELLISDKTYSALDRKHKQVFGEGIIGTKVGSSYSARNKTSDTTLPHIPTLRFITGMPKSHTDLTGNHSNGRHVNLSLRNSVNGYHSNVYNQRQATAVDLRVVKAPLDSILCVSTWNYSMPLSARELGSHDEPQHSNASKRSPRL